jgi:FKBP-type peptidyl-prolyl cis-trans isomerase
MKRLAVALSAAVVSLSAMANGSVSEQKVDSLSQAMATSWGAMLKAQLSQRVDEMKSMGFALDKQKVIVALGSYLKGEQMAFTAKEAEAYLNAYVEGLMPKEEALSLESQQEFLDKQLSRPGVIKTASGLVFETVKEGTGRSPKLTDKVRVLYKGRLADGTVFDSTDNEGPIEFDVNRLVKGFTEGLLLMREGGQYRLFIPASFVYGERGAGGVIPPNAALDFEVTLIEIINQ